MKDTTFPKLLAVIGAILLVAGLCGALAQQPTVDKSVDSHTTSWNTNRMQAATRDGRSYLFLLANDSGSTVYIHLFDAANLAAVTNNATPLIVGIPVATGTVGGLDTPYSLPLENGLCLAASSTRYKTTLVSSTNLAWSVLYKDRP